MSVMRESYDDYMKRRSREEDEKLRSRLPSVRERYAEFLENCADEIVAIELQNAYETCVEEGDEDMMYCIRKILQYYMPASEYNIWRDTTDKD